MFDPVGEISPVQRRVSSAWRVTPVFEKMCSRWVCGEDTYTNRKDQAHRNIFTLNAIVLELTASFGLSPKIAIERCQDDKNLAVAWLSA